MGAFCFSGRTRVATLRGMFDLATYLAENQARIDSSLDRHLPKATERPSRLHEAMRYSVFAGGKRLRPILALAAAEAVGGDLEEILLPASAIEILHTYTLIHDDLPSMDDDDLRRGKPSLHVAFDEPTAILAGDALLTMSFEWMAKSEPPKPYRPNRLALELAKAAGSAGVIAGQMEDMAAEGREIDHDQLMFIHLHKTATLMRASIRIGAIAAGAKPADLDQLTMYGGDVGLAFQVTDDILDETASEEDLGKPIGSDRGRNKATFVSLLGLEASRARAKELIDNAISQLAGLPGRTEPLAAIAQFVLDRAH